MVLFELKELNKISDFFSEWIEDRKLLNFLCHFIKVHACQINVLIIILGIFDLNNECILGYGQVMVFVGSGILSLERRIFLVMNVLIL